VNVDLNLIIRRIAKAYGVKVSDLRGPKRWPGLLRARKQAYRECRLAGASYPEIGRALHRHHTTVMHAVRGLAGPCFQVALPSGWIDWCEVSA
jgi:chromosomal replication initiation ATPase DnaA